MDFNLLVALHALLEEGSVTLAAERLGITQPGMTHILNKLRALFDDPLLERAENKMYPTELASSLMVPLEDMMRISDEIFHYSETFDPAQCTLEFKMFLEDTGQTVMAASLYTHLAKVAPRARLRLIRQATQDDFQRGNIDLVLWHRRHDGPFFSKLAWESRFVTVARKGHPSVGKGRISLSEFARLPQVTMEGRGAFEVDVDASIDKIMDDAGLIRNKVVAISSLLAVKRLVGATDVIATVPEVLLTAYEPDVQLQVVKTELNLKPVPIYLIWHRRTNSHPAHRWFREFILEQYSRLVQEPKPASKRSGAIKKA
ncbi:MAG: LysR family transcriptional regulator [Proteobacteria bacterium]|nr:LysR family transcriptional regulator [Pseudomonadota bacterium]